jgi:Flp pilus assembly protein TadD
VNYDDETYVTHNTDVAQGLTPNGVLWALMTTEASNWHPLTWLSLQLDATVFGISPFGFHLTNVLLHAASTLLLFGVLRSMTDCTWPSAFVAALFGLHPLHVESVAWVAERKDVLSTFLGVLTIWAYQRYTQGGRALDYALVVLGMILCIMAKPMLVTLPFILLLLDFWPLGRARLQSWRGLVTEKIPLFGLTAASAGMTLWAQQQGGAVIAMEQFPVNARLANASLSCTGYLAKAIAPDSLAVFYPMSLRSLELDPTRAALAATFLACCSAAALALRRKYPYVFVGWFWYLGTLAPVVGLVQVGAQAMADRYTYVPLIGIFIILAWAAAGLVRRLHLPRVLWATAGLAIAGCLLVITRRQVAHWHDSVQLWQHAIANTQDNSFAHYSLGLAWAREGQIDKAIAEYQQAIDLNGRDALGHHNLGVALMRQGDLEGAIGHFREATEIEPAKANAHHQLGVALSCLGQDDAAIRSFRRAIDLLPASGQYRYDLGHSLWELGKGDEARAEYGRAQELDPGWLSASAEWAWARATRTGARPRNDQFVVRVAEQICEASAFAWPDYLDTLAAAYADAGRFEDARAMEGRALAALGEHPTWVKPMRHRLELYEMHRPYRRPAGVLQKWQAP